MAPRQIVAHYNNDEKSNTNDDLLLLSPRDTDYYNNYNWDEYLTTSKCSRFRRQIGNMDDSYDQIMDGIDDGLTVNQGSGADILEEEDTHPRRSSYHHSSHHSQDDGGRRRGDDNSGSDRDQERDNRGDYHRRRRDSRDFGSNGTLVASGADTAAAVAGRGASASAGGGPGRSRSRSPAGRQHVEDSYRGDHRAYETTSGTRDDKYETDRGERAERRGSDYDRAPRGGRSRSRSPVAGSSSKVTAPGFLRDRRVYVGNLSYDVAWTDLKDFMREGNNTGVFIMTLLAFFDISLPVPC